MAQVSPITTRNTLSFRKEVIPYNSDNGGGYEESLQRKAELVN